MSSEAQWRSRIVKEAISWEGTKYHGGAAVKKGPGEAGGVDCAMFPAATFSAVGLIERPNPGTYSQQWMLHRSEEIYLGWIRKYAREIPVESVQPGDLIAWKFEGCLTYAHAAIVLDPPIVIHAVFGSCVTRSDIERDEKLRLSPKLAFSVFAKDGKPLRRRKRA